MVDSAGHMLGGCNHKELKSRYISRHDTALIKVLIELLQGVLGAHFVIADKGAWESLQQFGAHSKRIPDFVMQDNSSQTDGEEQAKTLERDKMRPDIMIVEWTDAERETYMTGNPMPTLSPTMQDNRPRKVWIVEGGYCTDTRYMDKLLRKELQHKQLQESLKQRGFEVILLPIVLGVTGTIYKTNIAALSALGIEQDKAKKLLKELHLHAVISHHTIIKLRRKLENINMSKTKKQTKDSFRPP